MQKYKESGSTGVFSRGIPKNEVVFPRRPEHFPTQMILRKGNALPDFVFVGYEKGGPMVSRRMQAVIEMHEPAGAGFQFHPVQIVRPDGSVFSDDYVFWDVFRRVEAIDPAGSVSPSSKDEYEAGNHFWNRISLQSKDQLAEGRQQRWVKKSVVGDAAAWSETRYGSDLSMPIWIADALWDDLTAAGFNGFKPVSTWGEV